MQTAQSLQTTYYDYDYISDMSSTRLDFNSLNPAVGYADVRAQPAIGPATTATRSSHHITMAATEFDAHKCRRQQQQQQQKKPSSKPTTTTETPSSSSSSSSRNSRSLHQSPYHSSNIRTNSAGSKPNGERLKYVTFSNEYLSNAQSDAFKIISFQDEILNRFQCEAFKDVVTSAPQQLYAITQPPRPKSAVITPSDHEYFYTDFLLQRQFNKAV